MRGELLARSGLLVAEIVCDHPDRVVARGDLVKFLRAGEGVTVPALGNRPTLVIEAEEDEILLLHHNAYVNTGLNNALDREWGLGGTAIGWIGVDNNSTAVTATTTFLHGAAAGSAATTIIKAISPAATRTAQTTTGGATFVNADFTSGVFVQNKIGLLNTSTDAGTGLIDVIGGTGGTAPYNRTFVLDLTAAGTFSETLQIAVTATAV